MEVNNSNSLSLMRWQSVEESFLPEISVNDWEYATVPPLGLTVVVLYRMGFEAVQRLYAEKPQDI
jgi:hypothetical protein